MSGGCGSARRDAVSWTTPTSTEIATVAKSGLAAGLAWWIATLVTDAPDPVLAPLTALVVVQVSVRASFFAAIQRTAAVVLGVFLALAIGDALGLNGVTVGLLVAATLGVAQLVLRLPAAAARQVPISGLVVLAAVTSDPASLGRERALDTVLGATVGLVVSLVLPASRLVDARQTLDRLAVSLGDVLDAMGAGLQQAWSADQTAEWRRLARTTRDRLVRQASEAVGNGRESARWNVRDRRHIAALGRYEEVMPRLERTAIGVSVISRWPRRSRPPHGNNAPGDARNGSAPVLAGERNSRVGARRRCRIGRCRCQPRARRSAGAKRPVRTRRRSPSAVGPGTRRIARRRRGRGRPARRRPARGRVARLRSAVGAGGSNRR